MISLFYTELESFYNMKRFRSVAFQRTFTKVHFLCVQEVLPISQGYNKILLTKQGKFVWLQQERYKRPKTFVAPFLITSITWLFLFSLLFLPFNTRKTFQPFKLRKRPFSRNHSLVSTHTCLVESNQPLKSCCSHRLAPSTYKSLFELLHYGRAMVLRVIL